MDPIIVLIAIGVCLIAYAAFRPRPEPGPELMQTLRAMAQIDAETKQAIRRDQDAVEADINTRYPDHKVF